MRPEFATEIENDFETEIESPPQAPAVFSEEARAQAIKRLFESAVDKRRRAWRNDLQVEQRVTLGRTVQKKVGSQWYGMTVHEHIVIRPGEVIALPEEFSDAVQRVRCSDKKCLEKTGGHCSDLSHPGREVIGGVAPMLTRIGAQPERAKALTDQIFIIDGEKFRTDGTRVHDPPPPDPTRTRKHKIES